MIIFKKFINNRYRNYIKYKCPECKKNIECRADHKNKSGLCQKCSSRKLMLKKLKGGIEHPSYKNGIGIYQKETYKQKEKKCEICNIIESYIIVHHIDGNRKNNNPKNHLVLCNSCHCLLHHRLKRGKTTEGAIIDIKNLKLNGNYKVRHGS
jgi:DNA-directed RNA polymerase subunit RPC12/RpoP